jgi:hypothetical protein
MTSERNLQNRIDSLKNESDKRIDPSCYYIVSITISNIFLKHLKEITKEFCEGKQPKIKQWGIKQWTPPILAYICNNNVQFVFSTTDGEHNLNGSQQKICSMFTSIFTLKLFRFLKTKDLCCETNLIELQERYLILVYFQCKIYNYSIMRMESFLQKKQKKKKCTDANMKSLTNKERMEILKNHGIDWEKIQSYLKYGVFLKIIRKDNDKFIYERLSESFDIFNKLEYYQKFFFE